MQRRTVAMLDLLEKPDWFSRVGVNDSSNANMVSSWEEAVTHGCSEEWGSVLFEGTNQLCERLAARSQERFNRWNEIVDDVKKTTWPFVQRKMAGVAGKHSLPEDFLFTVHINIFDACMETEYADVYPPGFSSSLAYWYLKGHLPCGVQGVCTGHDRMRRRTFADLYPPDFYDPMAKWYEKGDFGNWQGQVPRGKLIVY